MRRPVVALDEWQPASHPPILWGMAVPTPGEVAAVRRVCQRVGAVDVLEMLGVK